MPALYGKTGSSSLGEPTPAGIAIASSTTQASLNAPLNYSPPLISETVLQKCPSQSEIPLVKFRFLAECHSGSSVDVPQRAGCSLRIVPFIKSVL